MCSQFAASNPTPSTKQTAHLLSPRHDGVQAAVGCCVKFVPLWEAGGLVLAQAVSGPEQQTHTHTRGKKHAGVW